MTKAYYNEIDPFAAMWLRELIRRGLIAPGDVDERSIEDVTADELSGYTQCHFFAGIGVWSYALRLAGWPDDRAVWTGSCPCQPFSAAGKKAGTADERHLWPALQWLIGQCRPHVIFGEQVASGDAQKWLDLVSTDLEGEGYAVGAAATVACGFGAPHKRQRLFFVADNAIIRREGWAGLRDCRPPEFWWDVAADHCIADELAEPLPARRTQGRSESGNGSAAGRGVAGELADTDERNEISERLQRHRIDGIEQADRGVMRKRRVGRGSGELGDARSERLPIRERQELYGTRLREEGRATQQPGDAPDRPGPVNGYWRDADWLLCRDGKWRPVEPGTFPLAHGAPARVGRLRGYGNAIVAQQAAAFIESYLIVTEGWLES